MNIEKRVFDVVKQNGESVKISTRRPNNQEIEISDMEYSRAFTNSVIAGLLPQETLESALRKRGILSEEKDLQREEQGELVSSLEEELENTPSENKQEVADRLKDARAKLFEMRQERSRLLAHSAEAKASNAQRDSIVSQVTEFAKNGAKVWRNIEDFMNETDGNIVFRATYEYMTFTNGLPSDFIEQLPENKVSEKPEKKEEVVIKEEPLKTETAVSTEKKG
ncbi:MAG: hypothetical protein M0P71_01390 [Melioribacteraceae bacterium]|nr:hypothetical protein [Melioribacteraceae bacterium]